ncbi:MAG: hypothetical protein JO357_18325, partial [Hyphomicrobiales bacterium]|nr:hypothetical protein [Hyphomicrobiales bacterium]
MSRKLVPDDKGKKRTKFALRVSMTAHAALREIWSCAGAPEDLLSDIALTGEEPVLPSSFKIDLAAQVSIGASALAAADLWRLRSGRRQAVSVDR